MKYSTILIMFFAGKIVAQPSLTRVLFLGNSYTYFNDLPGMLSKIASSTGDSIFYDSNAPGGYRLSDHSSDPASIAKISQGGWDFVVLQEQSQLPSFPENQVQSNVFPFARMLDSIINSMNSCAETVFYMTWGRKNGDASNCATWPPVCTYSGMDSLLGLRYRMMADSNNAVLSPVGAVWRYIRTNHPSLELYQPDESHPSVEGTYAAACSFFAVMLRKDPASIVFNSALQPGVAAMIRAAAKSVVYDSLANWFVGTYDPSAGFSFQLTAPAQVTFLNSSVNASNYIWKFGDGHTAADENPVHTYIGAGIYTVTMIAEKCGLNDSVTKTVNIVSSGLNAGESIESRFRIYPNPAGKELYVRNVFEKEIEYRLYETCGNLAGQGKVNRYAPAIDISGLTDGMYLVQFSGRNLLPVYHRFVKIQE